MRNFPLVDGFKIENLFEPANIDYDPKSQHEDRLKRITEPTVEQCLANEQLPDYKGRKAFACWYPQMGGYGSKCVIVMDENNSCFDAHVWHDGDFPFNDGQPPVVLHHCCAEQFIEFGQMVKGLQNGNT